MGTAVSLVLLVGVLGFAVVRPRGLPEVVGAGPAALLAVVFGLVPWRDALAELRDLGPHRRVSGRRTPARSSRR